MPLVVAVSLALVMLLSASAAGQTVEEDYMSRLERARALEREIADLQARLAQAQKDWLTLSERLEEIQRKILDCYLQMDAAESEVANARRVLNSRLRYLYMEGDKQALVELLSSRDVTDFVARYSYVLKMADSEASAFRLLREKRDKLRLKQEQLNALKKEAAELTRGSDTAGIEALIAQKQEELARVNGSIIAEQLPASVSSLPTDFNPNRVFSKPEENGFVRTGQIFSGYASWYGGEFHNRPTASGEIFNQYGFTCAHRTLPFGTWLRVTFRDRSVIVKVNDRGPLAPGRTLDLSRGAAEAVGLSGVQWVDCELVVPR